MLTTAHIPLVWTHELWFSRPVGSLPGKQAALFVIPNLALRRRGQQYVSVVFFNIFISHFFRTHTKRYAAASPQMTFYIFKKFLNSLTLTRNLRAPWRWSE